MGKLEDVGSLYEQRPYPAVGLLSPLWQPLRRDDLPLLNYQAGYASCYGSLRGSTVTPRILVAGCGTFEPVAVALANPQAEILAVDLSAQSLKKLRWQARLRGVSARIRTLQMPLESLSEGGFDYVVATGVLHHLVDPARGLEILTRLSKPKAVFRLMVYSRWGRDLLYGTKKLAELLRVSEPKEMRHLVASLPPDHPYRIYFHLYSDAANDAGLADGYLHPCDTPFDALSLRAFLGAQRLTVARFLHRPEGQPEVAEALAAFAPHQDDWDRLALLEALAQLDENFSFFAGKKGERAQGGRFVWNPALPRKGTYHSKLLGKKIDFDRSWDLSALEVKVRADLVQALFLLPGGEE